MKSKPRINESIDLFQTIFNGFEDAYGTYNIATGKYYQKKQKVTKKTIYNHLKGIQPFGFYPLKEDKTTLGIIDFDDHNLHPVLQFIQRGSHYNLPAYLEISKSKGYHVWIFFHQNGVSAYLVRSVLKHILNEIDQPNVEVFPKQDSLKKGSYGNFINAPLFGKLVPFGKTIFVKPNIDLQPYSNQWDFLKSIKRIDKQTLESIVKINDIHSPQNKTPDNSNHKTTTISGFGLPICIRRILMEGVTFNQRVACFRIAVHLRRLGLPKEITTTILLDWKSKNQPKDGKRIITKQEIKEQIYWAFKNEYSGYGCSDPVIKFFCEEKCPLIINKLISNAKKL